MRLKACAPARLRKQPEIFCWTLIMRKSRSARLLSKSTRRSSRKQKTAFWWVRRPSSRFLAALCGQRPFFPGDDFQWMQPALSFGSCLFCRGLHVQEQFFEIGGPDSVLFFRQKDQLTQEMHDAEGVLAPVQEIRPPAIMDGDPV